MGSTNYAKTFIRVAEDCAADTGVEPPLGPKGQTIASLQYGLISEHPYELTSDDVLFEVHAIRNGIRDDAREEERTRFFAKDQPCLRSSPLGKRYGWGIHHDRNGRIALVPRESREYRDLSEDISLVQLKGMRSKRA